MILKNWHKAYGAMLSNQNYAIDTLGLVAYAKDASSPPTRLRGTDAFNSLMISTLKTSKSDFSGDGIKNDYYGFMGVIFGTGTTPATIDDYQMAGEHYIDYAVSYYYEAIYDESGVTNKCTYTLTNTLETSVTIGEIGLSIPVSRGSSSYYYTGLLVERTVLDNPITIEPGGVGQVTYEIKMNYPT